VTNIEGAVCLNECPSGTTLLDGVCYRCSYNCEKCAPDEFFIQVEDKYTCILANSCPPGYKSNLESRECEVATDSELIFWLEHDTMIGNNNM
jgi:hypothetical protein